MDIFIYITFISDTYRITINDDLKNNNGWFRVIYFSLCPLFPSFTFCMYSLGITPNSSLKQCLK